MDRLSALGFGPAFFSQLSLEEIDPLRWARVTRSAHGALRVLAVDGEHSAILDGPLRDRRDPVVVGDWVALRRGDPNVAVRRLERTTALRRRDPGGGVQIVAANLDLALLCLAVDRDFNLRRLERWLALCAEAEVEPLVVLTKADRDAPAAEAAAGVERITSAPCLPVSARDDLGREALFAHLAPGRTAALLGSSGVGKSTLVNWLLGQEIMEVGGLRGDGRGRHTTTRRELLALPNGSFLVDNPGVRQVGPIDRASVDSVFDDVREAADNCRFRDCAHDTEPGCGVRAALAQGSLTEERLAAWRKLERELAFEERRADPAAQRAERERWKKIHLQARRRDKARRGAF